LNISARTLDEISSGFSLFPILRSVFPFVPLNAIENINLYSKSHYAAPIAEPLWPFHACSGMQYAASCIKDESPYSAEISRVAMEAEGGLS